MKFVCPGLQMSTENYEQLADPEGLSWQVLAHFDAYPFFGCK